MLATKIGFIGAGRMATALARGFVQAGLFRAEEVIACDPSPEAQSLFLAEVPGATVVAENQQAARESQVVLLAVKPQQMDSVLADIRSALDTHSVERPRCLVISIAAGVLLSKLTAGLAEGTPIVRVMPNTPCLVGCGASAYSLGSHATEDDGSLVAKLLSAVGQAHEVPEEQLDAVTGLSGSGPAFVYTVIESLAEGGKQMGLPEPLALALAAQTVLGAAEMVIRTEELPTVLRDRVTSPGGTTVAGLNALEEGAFSATLVDAVRAATHRSKELGKTL